MPVSRPIFRFCLLAVLLLLSISQAIAGPQPYTASQLAQVEQVLSQSLSRRSYQNFLTMVSNNQANNVPMDSASLWLQMSQMLANQTKSYKKAGNQFVVSILQKDQQVIDAVLTPPGGPGSNGINTGSGAAYNPAVQSRPGQVRNGLPPTMFDSFVAEAGKQADNIYGDEGEKRPPFMGFTWWHRINSGIDGRRDQGLTTGHGSYLPDAWGADEFIAPPGEWSQSGGNGGQLASNNPALPWSRPVSAVDQIDPSLSTDDPSYYNAPNVISQGSPTGDPQAKFDIGTTNPVTFASPGSAPTGSSGF